MNKGLKKRLAAVFLAIAMVFTTVGVAPTTEITVEAANTKSLKMNLGDQLRVSFGPGYKTSYKTNNKKVLIVAKDGTMTAVGVGKAKMTMSTGSYSVVYNVKVSLTGNSKWDKKVKKLAKDITKGKKTDAEKVKAVHDYIVKNTKYDIQGYKAGQIKSTDRTTKGVLSTHKAVCEGYAKTFCCFMYALKIPCYYVSGTANNGSGTQSHAWNLVKIDGKWYQTDVTWDDPVPDNGDTVLYSYFLKTDKQLGKDHKWNKTGLPTAKTSGNKYISLMDGIVCNNQSELSEAVAKRVAAGPGTDSYIIKNDSDMDLNTIYQIFDSQPGVSGKRIYPSRDYFGDYTIYMIRFE